MSKTEQWWYVGESFNKERGCWVPSLECVTAIRTTKNFIITLGMRSNEVKLSKEGFFLDQKDALRRYIGVKNVRLAEVTEERHNILASLDYAKGLLERAATGEDHG